MATKLSQEEIYGYQKSLIVITHFVKGKKCKRLAIQEKKQKFRF